MDSTPFVSIVNGSDGNVFVIVRQTTVEGRVCEMVFNSAQFSGLMYMFKSIEKQFVTDEARKRANEIMADAASIDFQSSYDPCKPEMLNTSCDANTETSIHEMTQQEQKDHNSDGS